MALKNVLSSAFLAAAVFFCAPALAGDHADTVHLSQRHQEIDNFGASDAWTFQIIGGRGGYPGWSEASKNKVADLLFTTDKGIGLSLWRFNIGGGMMDRQTIRNPARTVETFEVEEGKYDWTKQAGELWFARAARDRGVPYLLGFVNSPPGRMTKNGLTNHGTDNTSSTNLKPGMEKPFAKYLCDIVEHFKDAPEKERLNFNYLSPINEPGVAWLASNNQEGSRAGNEDVKKVLMALHEEIRARKLNVKITAPETNSVRDMYQINNGNTRMWGEGKQQFGNYLGVFAADPALAPLLDGILCYHDYSSYTMPALVNDHRALGEAFKNYPNLKIWMSEVCILQNRRDLGMNMALDVARLIHADLVLSNASAWQWWLAMSPGDYKDGLLYTNWWNEGDEESIIESKTFWALGNYSRYVRPGYVRIGLTGEKHGFDGLLGSAYRDPKTGKTVLVYVNLANETQNVKWSIDGGDASVLPRRFSVFLTSEGENLAPKGEMTAGAGWTIPARSVATFVSE